MFVRRDSFRYDRTRPVVRSVGGRFRRGLLRNSVTFLGAAIAGFALAGCSREPQFRLNQVEFLKIQYQQAAKSTPLADAQRQNVVDILGGLFGTPNDPHVPYLLGDEDPLRDLIDQVNLQRAAGAVRSDRRGEQVGLYREHCAHCHGITGDGAGPTAGFLNPYPRDFRLGKFKFKSTKLGKPPTDDDLARVIRQGIPGTAMPAFRTLDDHELTALVDYVKYLAIRGQVEMRLLAELPGLETGEPLVDLTWRQQHPGALGEIADDPQKSEYEDQLSFVVEDILFDVVERWENRSPSPVPEPPTGLWQEGPEFASLVERGRTLFGGKANCAQCHGQTGLGDGQTENYDDWTSQWVKGANIDPLDVQAYAPFVAVGALPPRAIRPRNLRFRIYRGGDQIADLYRRIANGIEGSGMPDASALSEDEVWALVAFVLNLPYEPVGGAALHALPAGPQQ